MTFVRLCVKNWTRPSSPLHHDHVTMKNPHVIWASVAIVVVLVAGVVILAITNKDVGEIEHLAILVALPILSAFGVAIYQKMDQTAENANTKLEQVKEATNGNNGKLLEMVQDLHQTVTNLALQVPVPSVPEEDTREIK